MQRPEPDTEALLQRVQAGDSSAIEPLLARHRGRLRRMVRCCMDDRLRPRLDPSDVVQETLIRALRKLPRYLHDRPLPFYPWLRQIAWDRLIELHRRHLHAATRSIARETQGQLSAASVMALAQQIVAGEGSPSRELVHNEIRERVRKGLADLSAQDRELLLMRHLERLRVSEIAAALEISEAAVKSRLRRALERLHHTLGSDIAEGLE
jgi:RNA polymerase sigma-70 factor, ECF subfamily